MKKFNSITYELIYDDQGEIYVLGEVSSNMGMMVEQAVGMLGINLNELFINEMGWDDYDYNCLNLRIKELQD